ncbi:hypothetical protein CMV_027833 [Castanea mollissima]|uniref:HMA domain-containing protein n=1 Tax=Castanea mollissima TaxID=60419 RepID=A0A8J4Q989_9ROSI|nr:hypothetical protein CMV_027833 [Castanea mollissima]
MAEELKKSYFEVLGLCCASEVTLVERILKQLNGVQEISVILPTKTVVVHHTHVISDVTIAEALNKYVYHPLEWLALGAVIVGLPTLILRSIASIRNLTLNINILVLMAVIGTLALQDYWEAGTVVFLFSIAQWLETRASYKV